MSMARDLTLGADVNAITIVTGVFDRYPSLLDSLDSLETFEGFSGARRARGDSEYYFAPT
jgi:hypothetical protein